MHKSYVAGYEADVDFQPTCLLAQIDNKNAEEIYVIQVPVRV